MVCVAICSLYVLFKIIKSYRKEQRFQAWLRKPRMMGNHFEYNIKFMTEKDYMMVMRIIFNRENA